MQWNSKQNAGFSNAEPWIEVNPNYKEINVEKDLENKDSIYRFYQKAIDLRKSNEILIDGAYALIAADDSDIIASGTTDIVSLLKAEGYNKTGFIYHNVKDSAGDIGRKTCARQSAADGRN